jgi:hypothetical protein
VLRNSLQQPKKFYAGITGTLFFLTPILNLGSVRIINEFLEELKLPSALSAKGYLVGFSTAVMWSPYFASVSLVLHYLNIAYKDYIIFGIGLSLLSLVIGNILFAIWEKRHPLPKESGNLVPLEKRDRNQLFSILEKRKLDIGELETKIAWLQIIVNKKTTQKNSYIKNYYEFLQPIRHTKNK